MFSEYTGQGEVVLPEAWRPGLALVHEMVALFSLSLSVSP